MTRLSLALLGPMQITLDGQPVSGFAYNKARALLVYLAVEADRPHQRDALVGAAVARAARHAARAPTCARRWPTCARRSAMRSAAPPFLLITRDTIQFNPASDYELDVAAFTALLATCETHAHRHLERCRSCAARMEQALALYRGDFLAEFALGDSAPFEEWAAAAARAAAPARARRARPPGRLPRAARRRRARPPLCPAPDRAGSLARGGAPPADAAAGARRAAQRRPGAVRDLPPHPGARPGRRAGSRDHRAVRAASATAQLSCRQETETTADCP